MVDTHFLLLPIFLAVSLALMGCPADTISDEPLSGLLDGVEWTYESGETSAFLSDDETYVADLYDEAFTPCAMESPVWTNGLIVSIPTEVGVYDLGPALTMTFVTDADTAPHNLVATAGMIEVEEIADGMVHAGLHARYDDDNEVDGRFEVAICN